MILQHRNWLAQGTTTNAHLGQDSYTKKLQENPCHAGNFKRDVDRALTSAGNQSVNPQIQAVTIDKNAESKHDDFRNAMMPGCKASTRNFKHPE
jgi:hypothetical protein